MNAAGCPAMSRGGAADQNGPAAACEVVMVLDDGHHCTSGDEELTDELEKEQDSGANELQAEECSSVIGGGDCKAAPSWCFETRVEHTGTCGGSRD